MDKNKAYEQFKATVGAEDYKVLKENLITAKEKKNTMNNLARTLNELAKSINALKDKIQQKQLEKSGTQYHK